MNTKYMNFSVTYDGEEVIEIPTHTKYPDGMTEDQMSFYALGTIDATFMSEDHEFSPQVTGIE